MTQVKERQTKIIEIEGIDGAGKTTLVRNLENFYEAAGKRVLSIKFPDYGETPTGKLIRQWLNKEWTTGDEVRDAFIHQCLQIVNRLDLLPAREDLEKYDLLLLDRYYTSTLIYGEMDGLDPTWLRHICHQLPAPDHTILLQISVEESFRRRPERSDRYEERKDHMQRVLDAYNVRSLEAGVSTIDTTELSKNDTFVRAADIITGVFAG